MVLVYLCSFVRNKIWLEADTWKVWTWCKDGNVMTLLANLCSFKSYNMVSLLWNCVNKAFCSC